MKNITDKKIIELTDEILNELVIKIQQAIDPKDEYGQGDIWGMHCSHDFDELTQMVADYMITKKNEVIIVCKESDDDDDRCDRNSSHIDTNN